MSNISSFSNGGTLLEVSMPPQLTGASPTTFFCGNMIWKQMMQSGKKEQPLRKQPVNVVSNVAAIPQTRQEYSQLHVSACLGQFKATNAILEGCTVGDLNKQDHNGNTPLHWAASEGNDEVVQLLVDSRAEMNAQNFAGETPLFVAASRGLDSICAILLENGANPNISNIEGASPVHMAAAAGHSSTILLLLSRGSFVNGQDEVGDTPLHYAVREEQFETVEMLVTRCNASVDMNNDDFETPLQLASCLDCTAMVQFLAKFASNKDITVRMDECDSENKHEGSSNAMFQVQGNFGW